MTDAKKYTAFIAKGSKGLYVPVNANEEKLGFEHGDQVEVVLLHKANKAQGDPPLDPNKKR